MTHWCRDIPRDEAVRAAEDGRSGPPPTLEECIERQQQACALACVKDGFARLDEAWGRVPKSVSASSAVEQENKGDSMADRAEISRAGQFAPPQPSRGPKCTERESVAGRRPPEPGGSGNVTGFTEPAKCSPSLSESGEGQSGLRTERITLEITGAPGWTVQVHGCDVESFRVVEEVHFDDLANMSLERDAAIRERDALIARADYLERDRKFWCLQSWTHEQAANVLRARVAELEAAAKLAPAANADAVSKLRPISGAGKSAGEETQAASGAAGTKWCYQSASSRPKAPT